MADAITVGLTSMKICDKNPTRRHITIVNDSANLVYVFPGRTAVINSGYRLNSGGGALDDTPNPLGWIFTGEYHAIASGANSNVTVVEL